MKITDQFIEEVDKFIAEVDQEIKNPEVVLETKELVDELSIRMVKTIKEFVEEKEELKGKPLLAASVAHRAAFFLGSLVSYEWCIHAVAGRHYLVRQKAKKELEKANLELVK